MNDSIRTILKDHARLSCDIGSLSDRSDLFAAGMTSHATVNVILALEIAFEVEFPNQMLSRVVFESVASIRGAIEELKMGRFVPKMAEVTK
jgi:acyl carrier protein